MEKNSVTIRQRTGAVRLELKQQKEQLKLLVESIYFKIDKLEDMIVEHAKKEDNK